MINRILGFLDPKKIKELADKHGSNDIRKGGKLPLIQFVLFAIFSAAIKEEGSYLPQIQTELMQYFDIDISKQGISKQMVKKRSWKLFRDLYSYLLRKSTRIHGEKISKRQLTILNGFRDILIPDSSSFRLFKTLLEDKYESTKKNIAGCKLHTLFSFKSVQAIKVKITEQKAHDNNFNFVTLKKGVVYIFDLGYWSYETLQKIIDRKSYFVSRVKKGCDPVICAVNGDAAHEFVGKKLSEVMEHFQEDTIDVLVKIEDIKKELRIVGLLYKREWHLYITNIFDEDMTPKMIYELYRVRWQVELFFKWIKTYLNGRKLCLKTENSMLIEIYSTLIYCLFVVLFIDEARESDTSIHEYSIVKVSNVMKKYSMNLLVAIFRRDILRLSRILPRILQSLRKCLKGPRSHLERKNPHLFE